MHSIKHCLLLAALFFVHATCIAQRVDGPSGVVIIEEEQPVPDYCRFIDDISIRDLGFKMNCGYDKVLLDAKAKVAAKGGNILKITRWKKPSALGSSCYQVWGKAYYTDSLAWVATQVSAPDTVTAKLIPDTARYALLYIYRPRASAGAVLKYVVHVNDSEVCTVSNGSCDTVRIYEEGPKSIWATIETRTEQPLNVHFGKVYFLRCSIGMGVWVGRPNIYIEQPNKGYSDYMNIIAARNRRRR